MKKNSLVLVTIIVLAVLALTPTVEAASAQAGGQLATKAVGCQRGACTGLDPEVQGCGDDARTVDHFLASYYSNLGDDVYVELRHSDACHARWIRVTSGPSDWGCGGGAQPQVRLRDLKSGGGEIDKVVRNFSACADFPIWSKMIGRTSGSDHVQFCFHEVGEGWGTSSIYAPCKSQNWP